MDEDSSEEYENARQEQIRQNRALLASLGLNAETTRIRSPSPPRPPKRPRATKSKKEEDDSDDDDPLATAAPAPWRRPSARLASRGRTSYNEKDLSRSASTSSLKSKRSQREGFRKSSRLSGSGRGKYHEGSTTPPTEDDYVPPTRLLKLTNPRPEPQEDDQSSSDGEEESQERMPLPTRETLPASHPGGKGALVFERAFSHFRPNLTPKEVLQGGAFGGTFFRPHYSTILKRELDPDAELAELPADWIEGLDRERYLTNEDYDPSVNRYGHKAGQSLAEWEKAGWIARADPRGWFQWYCKFYMGRRSRDDERQVGRWQRACGPAGRFKRSIAQKVNQNGAAWNDESITPVVRQVCWQWAYELSEKDYMDYLPK